MNTPQPVANDPKIEASINALIDTVIAEDEKEFKPGLESFSVHANKIRKSLHSAMRDLQERLQKGYDTIGSWLTTQGIPCPTVREEVSAAMEDEEQFQKRISGDEPLFQILGFSDADMANFYRAAYEITCSHDYEMGRDAFFFLVTIAPEFASHWLGLAICQTCLQEYEQALAATLQVIALDPSNIDSYMNAIYLHLQAHDTISAEALCAQGIEYGLAHSEEPGGQELVAALKNAHNFINLHKGG